MEPTGIVGWTSESETRGTMGLVWSCLATIFLCTWNAVHPNLPAHDEPALKILWRRVQYLVSALVAPEYMCLVALVEHFDARQVRKWIRDGRDLEEWSLTQCFYLNMGGLVAPVDDQFVSLDPEDCIGLLRSRAILPLKIKDRDIMDHSKADWVLKSLALVQVIWFVTQIIGRAAQGLSITTLELFTLGIIICAFVTYAAWWQKPFDVRRPTVMELEDEFAPTGREVKRVELVGSRKASQSVMPFVLGVLITVLFGAIHLVGWRFHFPTVVEMWMWRATSAASVVLPLLLTGLFLSDSQLDTVIVMLMGVYVICRLYMMVEMFAALRAVPSDVYQTPQWSQYFPAFG